MFVETLVAAGEWIAYPQAQKAALGMLKNWRNMPVSTKAEKGRKARAGKRALACLVFTCMNPLRVESWRLMTVHKKLPKDGLRVVIVPGRYEEPCSTLYFRDLVVSRITNSLGISNCLVVQCFPKLCMSMSESPETGKGQ